ncbi:uncharacterized protein V1518DRAFT_411883 [Limtongia smithiae]|uniref:uncharacterized protein n=1 Tax=Limtongia smithiae TaxID=1125753 RepID=UPI0034CD1C6A
MSRRRPYAPVLAALSLLRPTTTTPRTFIPASSRTMSTAFADKCRKVVCIGRNYYAHVVELNNAKPTAPFFFLKPPSSMLLPGAGPVLEPKGVKCHYEVELALIMGKKMVDFTYSADEKEALKEAIDYVDGYAVAIDMTGRNVQEEIKKKGLPWTTAKGFDTFLPISAYIPKASIPDPSDCTLFLTVNKQTPYNQHDSTNLMMWKIPELLKAISSVMTLMPGDIVLTGTPKGVGSVVSGDHIDAGVEVDGKVVPESVISVDIAPKGGVYVFEEK